MIHLRGMAIGSTGRVTLTGYSFNTSSSTNPTYGYIIIDADGNIYTKTNGGAPTQRNTATDWVRPTDRAPGDYEVRYTNPTGDTAYLSATTAVDTWHPLSSGDWNINVYDNIIGIGGKTCTFDIEIRKGSTGAAIASASHTITADYDPL